jgi:hypothetical protein
MITPVAQLFAGLLAISQSVPSDETASVSLALKYTGLDRVSSSRMRAIALFARSVAPVSALLAATMISAGRKVVGMHQAIFHSGQCVIIASNPGVGAPVERIEWAEALGAREMLDCRVGFAIKNPYPTTKEPSSRKIRIEHESPIDHGDAHVEVVGDACNYKPRDTQCCRIVLTQSCRKPRQSLCFERLYMARHPERN